MIRDLIASMTFLSLIPGWTTSAQTNSHVKVTPLGGQAGEFCPLDRAFVFEDPDGTRILYDAGRTVAGADDPRLGEIDVVLISHMRSTQRRTRTA